MTAAITTLITAFSAVVVAVLAYLFTKQREREAELRKEKLEHYKALVSSLSGILDDASSPEGKKAFAVACNNFLLFAPQSAIEALQEFQKETSIRNAAPSRERHDRLLSALLFEIRKDLRVHPKDVPESFRVFLWSSGAKPDGSEFDAPSK
jgi:hypothetical protein